MNRATRTLFIASLEMLMHVATIHAQSLIGRSLK
jgi:hypothetical protein